MKRESSKPEKKRISNMRLLALLFLVYITQAARVRRQVDKILKKDKLLRKSK